MKRGIWIAIAIGLVLILIGVVVILMYIPLGPALTNKNTAYTPTVVSAEYTLTPSLVTETIPPVNATLSPTVDFSPTPTLLTAVASATSEGSSCGTGSMTVLALGEGVQSHGADAIRLVRVDFDNKRIDLLSLPSNLWVKTPGLSSAGIREATLSNVYFLGKTRAQGEERLKIFAAVDLLAKTLQANFGYLPDHYFVLNEAAFSEFVDALDGVDVTLPAPVDGRPEGVGKYPAGRQHLNGQEALDLVRLISTNETDMINRQELIIQAVYQSLMTPQNWVRLPALVDAFHNNVFTDFSVTQLLEVSCVLNQTGVVVNQVQVGTQLLVIRGNQTRPGPGLGTYILELVGK